MSGFPIALPSSTCHAFVISAAFDRLSRVLALAMATELRQRWISDRRSFFIERDCLAIGYESVFRTRWRRIPFENVSNDGTRVTLRQKGVLRLFWIGASLALVEVVARSVLSRTLFIPPGLSSALAAISFAIYARLKQDYLIFGEGNSVFMVMTDKPSGPEVQAFLRALADARAAFIEIRDAVIPAEPGVSYELERLARLRRFGEICDEEFEILKAAIIRDTADPPANQLPN